MDKASSANRMYALSFSTVLAWGLLVMSVSANAVDELQKLVLERMPDYRLTQEWNGKPVTISTAYSREAYDGRLPRTATVQQVLANFFAYHEKTGLKPAQIYMADANIASPQFWKIDFPGCRPGLCAEQAKNSTFTHSSKRQNDRFAGVASSNPSQSKEIVLARIEGVKYQAVVRVHYDDRGRVIKYYVEGYKEAETLREKRWARLSTKRPGTLPIPVFQYVNNLVLGVDSIIERTGRGDVGRFDQIIKGL